MEITVVCPYDITKPWGITNHVIQFSNYAAKQGNSVTVIAKKGEQQGLMQRPDFAKTSLITVSPWDALKLHTLLKKKSGIVHIHEPLTPILGLLALYLADVSMAKIVTTSHSNAVPNFRLEAARIITPILGGLMKKTSARIAVSKGAAEFARRYAGGNYSIIPNGVDTEIFSPKSSAVETSVDGKVNFLDGGLNILFVGRLNDANKGLDCLLDAYNVLKSKNKSARLIIVGPGQPTYTLARKIESAKSNGAVMEGGVPQALLARYYRTADIVCFPSTGGESFGTGLLEAMASQKPVVASSIPGFTETLGYSGEITLASGMFTATKTGILVKPGDRDGLANALEALVKDENSRTAMGFNGRERVLAHYIWEKVTRQILEVYKSVIRH